jgi:hypothetical protein
VTVRTSSVCSPCTKFLFEVFVLLSAAPLSAVVSDAMGAELFLLARTVLQSIWWWIVRGRCYWYLKTVNWKRFFDKHATLSTTLAGIPSIS